MFSISRVLVHLFYSMSHILAVCHVSLTGHLPHFSDVLCGSFSIPCFKDLLQVKMKNETLVCYVFLNDLLSSTVINKKMLFQRGQRGSQIDHFPAIENYLGEGNYLASCVASTLDIYNAIIKPMKSQQSLKDWKERNEKCINTLFLHFSLRITFISPVRKVEINNTTVCSSQVIYNVCYSS